MRQFLFRSCLGVAVALVTAVQASAAEPIDLLDLSEGGVQVKPSSGQVTAELGQSGLGAALFVQVEPGNDGYPGVGIAPGSGKAWDLSSYGHIVAEVTNPSERPIRLHVRVDNPGRWQDSPWNTEAASIKPGETRRIKVIFGHAHGHKPGFKLDPSRVTQVLMFTGKPKRPYSLRVNSIVAGGEPGEKPAVKPQNIRIRPQDGVMLGPGVNAEQQLKVDGTDFAAELSAGHIDLAFETPGANVGIAPVAGRWQLTDAIQVEVAVTNTGDGSVSPLASVRSDKDVSPEGGLDKPLAPGESGTLVAPFSSGVTWQGPSGELRKGHLSGQPGTGNRVLSDRIASVKLRLDDGVGRLRVDRITATAPPAVLPDWLGQRPPVSGEWTLTFRDEFDGSAIDESKWNIYTANFWDRRSHFSRENVIVNGGKARLRYEKKTGYMNDDPNDKHPKTGANQTDYAVGYLDTYDKFTQTYGYFEARMKLPTAPGLWPAFWTMPDRGDQGDLENWPRWKRQMTEFGGMEFDIMEHLTRWGPYRFNIAFHWDGYGKNHKATGSTAVYAAHDDEGFITSGLLWLPGVAVYYVNGHEVARWEHERIASVPAYVIFYMVSGGWDNNALDDAELPADFVIDYIRVWQRDDLVED